MHRCRFVDLEDSDYISYHDTEWGKPVYDDTRLFEMLMLECFQAGLSWQCILHKRPAFRQAFDNFDVQKVANYTPDKQKQLLQNNGIVRHALKISAATQNAKVFLKIADEFGSFSVYIWHWTDNKILRDTQQLAFSPLSDKISADLRARGMKFVGTTIIYSYLCAIGVVNAHEPDCFCAKP